MNFWIVVYRVCWAALFVMLAILAWSATVPKWRELREFERRKAELAREIAAEEEMIKLLRLKQEKFRGDPKFVERLAHDLGLARSNEVLIRVITDPAAPAAPDRRQRESPPPAPPAARPRATG